LPIKEKEGERKKVEKWRKEEQARKRRREMGIDRQTDQPNCD
jgi:hypothetical protein